MMLYNILIPVAMFVFSLDGYNAINHFRLWLQCRRALKGAAA
jgi:hypothetical protein